MTLRQTSHQAESFAEAQCSSLFLRRLLAGGAWAAASRGVSLTCLLASTALLTAILPKAEVGVYLWQAALAAVFSVLAIFGLSSIGVKLTREALAHQNWRQAQAVLRHVLAFMLISISLTALVYVSLLRLAEGSSIVAQLTPYIPWAIGWIALAALAQVVAELFRALDRFGWAALLGGQHGGALANFLFVLLLSCSLFFESLSLRGVLACQLLACLMPIVSALPAIYSAYRRLGRREDEPGEAAANGSAGSGLVALFREGYPVLIAQFIAISLLYFDLFVLGVYWGEAEVAVYGSVKRLLVFVSAPLLLANVALPPFVTELHVQGRLSQLEYLLRSAASLAVMATAPLLLLLVLWPGWILQTLFGRAYVGGGTVLVVLSLAQLVFVFTGSGGLALIMTGWQRVAMRLSLLTGFVEAITAIVLIRYWGALGAAVSAALLILVRDGLTAIQVKRYVGIWPCASLSPARILQSIRGLGGVLPPSIVPPTAVPCTKTK